LTSILHSFETIFVTTSHYRPDIDSTSESIQFSPLCIHHSTSTPESPRNLTRHTSHQVCSDTCESNCICCKPLADASSCAARHGCPFSAVKLVCQRGPVARHPLVSIMVVQCVCGDQVGQRPKLNSNASLKPTKAHIPAARLCHSRRPHAGKYGNST